MRTEAIEPDITAADAMKLLTLHHPGRVAPNSDAGDCPKGGGERCGCS
jgi:hypothetical protein